MPPSLHFLLLLLLFSISGTRGVVLGKPDIFPNEETMILDTGKPLNLTCRAAHPVAWCTDHKFTTEHYEEIYDEGNNKPYISILTIDAVSTSHVGYFSCVFNTSENKETNNCDVNDPSITSLYLYVKDLQHLMVKMQNNMVLHTTVGESVVLPCKPTFPDVTMKLTKNYEPYVCQNQCFYDPREGYTVTINETYTTFNCYGIYDSITTPYLGIIIRVLKPSETKPNQPTVDVESPWQEGLNEPVVYYVKEGSTVNLTCIYPFQDVPSTLRLEWTSTAVNESGTHRIIRQVRNEDNDKGRYYQINDAVPRDSGIYTCQAKVLQEYSEPSQLHIKVVATDATYLNTSIFHPNVTEVMHNMPVQWEIIFLAHPEPVFKWKKEGKLLRDSTTTKSREQYQNYEMNVAVQEASLSLYLHHPDLTDNGMYTLEATLPGTDLTTTTIMFLMMPGMPRKVEIKSPNDNQMFKEGDYFSLKCTAEGYPKPNLTLQFIPNNRSTTVGRAKAGTVYNDLQEEGGTGEDDETSMVVQTAHWMGVAEEPGEYWCQAKNEHGTDNSPRKQFLVTDGESPHLISLRLEIDNKIKTIVGKTVTVIEGDDLSLTCRANKVLVEAPLTWTLNGKPLDNTTQRKWDIDVTEEESRLSLLSTVRAQSLNRTAGTFSIMCMNKAGNTSLVFHVQEMVKPAWWGGPPGRNYNKNKNDNLTLSCPADGTPPPKVIWKKGDRILVENHRLKISKNQLVFQILLPTDNGKYMCEISNRAGSKSASFTVVVKDPDNQKTMIILAVVGVLILALVVLSVFFCRKIYQARKETLNLQLREQKMFMEGDPSSLNPDISLEQQAELLPYNNKYEVSRDSIIFDKLLGAGAFGRVYRATALNLLPGESRTTVAVKMIKSRTDCAQLKALRSEVKIMIHIGRHINIVNLLGACSKDLASKGELLLLVEYCKHGNILDFMRRHRREFVNQINDEDKIDPAFCEPRPRHRSDSSSRSHASRGLRYAHLNFHQDNVFYGTDQASDGATATSFNLLPQSRIDGAASCRPFRARTVSASSTNHHVASDNSLLPSETSGGTSDGYLSAPSLNDSHAPLCSTDILRWAYQIAKGMEYLAFKKVLHGDLAARNVLLAENNVVKISDFGLAKDIYKNDNYKKKSNGPVPVKWLAVECLRDGVFSTQSDVWSFGVVLWEIFSLGQIPYSCTEFDETFITKLEKGVRLEQPRYATYGLYRLILDCWNSDPMERPSFTSLEASLGEMLGEAQRQNYLQLTEPYQQQNESSEFLDLLPSQDYLAKVSNTTQMLTEDGYEMPFSPGVPPQLMVQGDRLSKASRLTSRQMDYLRSASDEDSSSSYVPMSADCTDGNTVFDFDNNAVASIMARHEKQENDHDLYLKMDKTPQHSPDPDTPDSSNPKAHESSPQHIVLKSVSSQGSQRGGHPELMKHDSGLYSPTVLIQTNPGYMSMSPLLSTDEQNYINTEAREANNHVHATCGTGDRAKARDYLTDSKCSAEYANLLSQDSGRESTESETSSGVGSVVGGSPTLGIQTQKVNTPPIPEEAMVM